MKRLTRRFIIKGLDGLSVSAPIRYERYYIDDFLRIQKKNEKYELEILNEENVLVEKKEIEKEEFLKLKQESTSEIIRDSYLYLEDSRVSIKRYNGIYDGLYRVEVKFSSEEEMNDYQKEDWMLAEITSSPLAFDRELRKLPEEEFRIELNNYLSRKVGKK